MPDIWLDVDTALANVPINTLPLIDETDGVTIEGAVTYDQSGLALFWHFITSAGVKTVTAVTPTASGDYDWTDDGTSGTYSIEIPASGGASANNDTEGTGWFTGKATGVMAWTGPRIGFRAAALNNALIDGGDLLDVSVTQLGGVAQSLTDLKNFADDGYDPATNKITGVLLADTITTYTGNTKQTGNVGVAGAGLTDLGAMSTAMKAEILVQVNAALDTAIVELTGVPAATPTMRVALMLQYMALRNKVDVQTSGTDSMEIHNDAGTKIAEKLLSDDGDDFSEAKLT